ncbi:unnamed protein product [Bursaphelenchus xylophilus]|uniref:N-acetylgalactosaminide beta-1,3-galactosyltransferase n=1 Tax=Bursaphelenchus xylophilus TaxID=6326 RepID=A0A7I8WMU2_BURXY|nr:unnamed protein product [Bursaphelenchus xylophilus]CAG9092483.1 unnamed protein product [Bursaphelenchus xylophilus]
MWTGLVVFVGIMATSVDAMKTPSILCIIHTSKGSHKTRLAVILDTWAKKCDDVLVFTDAPLEYDVPHVYFPMMNTRDHSWEKIRRVFRFAFEDMEKKYDWYLRADDDAYVLVDNARTLVKEHDPEKPAVLGYRWGFFEPRGYVDGGVYIVSRAGMKVFNDIMKNDTICPDFHRAEEDQEISRCLAKVGVYPVDTRDKLGRERFHHFHIDEFKSKYLVEFIKQNSFYGYKKFPEAISDTTVSFHHLTPYEMKVMDYLLNQLERKRGKLDASVLTSGRSIFSFLS